MRRRERWIRSAALAVAAGVTLSAVAQALSEHSLGPMWTLGWAPAVLVGTLGWQRTSRHCRVRPERRSRT